MIRSSRSITFACFLSTVAIVACDDRVVAPALSSPGVTSGSIRIVNTTTRAIYYVYLSPCSSTDWGTDKLGSTTIISGSSKQWDALAAGCWDAKAVLDNNLAAERLGITVAPGSVFQWSPAQSAFASIATTGEAVVSLKLPSVER